jgi:hypothetical protein
VHLVQQVEVWEMADHKLVPDFDFLAAFAFQDSLYYRPLRRYRIGMREAEELNPLPEIPKQSAKQKGFVWKLWVHLSAQSICFVSTAAVKGIDSKDGRLPHWCLLQEDCFLWESARRLA